MFCGESHAPTNEHITNSNILKDGFKLRVNIILNVLSKSKAQF